MASGAICQGNDDDPNTPHHWGPKHKRFYYDINLHRITTTKIWNDRGWNQINEIGDLSRVVSALSIPNSRRLHGTGILSYNQLANEFRRTELRHKSSQLLTQRRQSLWGKVAPKTKGSKQPLHLKEEAVKCQVKLSEAVGYVGQAEYVYRHMLQWNE